MRRAGLFVGTAALLGLAACGTSTAGIATPSPVAQAEQAPVAVAAAVQVPAGQELVGGYRATGVQTYSCTGNAWKGLEPTATLTDRNGKPIIIHSRGPVWISTEDGSAVEAAPVDGAKNDVEGAVPELLLKTRTARGDGLFGKVTYVQRLETEGGVAPSGGCKAGAQTSVPYKALYTFFKSAG
ncbi:DUF3455 domain-containing protein [Lentzea jiangxiensis]|uniref:DUF3455 domain-containing protein n=1 Tax=Lentzea jiangxiensis TaxID=641025 RepID=A0A1H0WKJ1_9PSEU|nr:DUF3455 domain-containing protein [Lentzea jiangxiensis]SDP91230.1 Protein of unknown function [Lentzea jiangxiensis]